MEGLDLSDFDQFKYFVEQKFEDKFDKAGKPYIYHLHFVQLFSSDVRSVRGKIVVGSQWGCNPPSVKEAWSIALGHDLLEDTDVTSDFLRKHNCSERVVAAIECLTRKKSETTDQYLKRILSNRDACIVKLADLRHNSDIHRLKELTDHDFKRLKKYHYMHKKIIERLNEAANA